MNVEAEADAPVNDGADSEKCRQVLRGAREVFLKRGFDGASMDQIAKAAGVSKGTLYVYYPSKEALFEALISRMKQTLAENFLVLETPSGDARRDLTEAFVPFVKALLNHEHIAVLRLMVGAAEAFPDMGERFYESGPKLGLSKLKAYLSGETKAGRLDIADVDRAAAHLMELTSSGMLKRLLFCPRQTVANETIDDAIRAGIDVFLRAYTVRS